MMKLMTTYKPFSIVVVPFPFTDSPKYKKRPAAVLSSEDHQKHSHHIVLLMITSAKHSEWHSDHKIIDLDVTGLTAESVIRQKIFTLDSRLILDTIGKLSPKDKEAIITCTQRHLKAITYA
jgi:mRNA interferase MazF